MIRTVTPNPSIDRTISVPAFVHGGVMTIDATSSEAGGKGLNVARAIAAEGTPVHAVALCGDRELSAFEALIDPRIQTVFVTCEGAVRTNLTVIEADGTTSKLNERGPQVDAAKAAELLDRGAEGVAAGDWVAGCGSLAPGLPTDFYVDLADRVHRAGGWVAIDTSGDALRAAATSRCDLLKPNDEELADLVGRSIATFGDVVEAAQEVRAGGPSAVLASLGADGALLISEDGVLHGAAATDVVRNTVGAGDALLAGFVEAMATTGSSPTPESKRAALAQGLAWSRAAVRSATTAMTPTSEDHAAVRIASDVDMSRMLTGAS